MVRMQQLTKILQDQGHDALSRPKRGNVRILLLGFVAIVIAYSMTVNKGLTVIKLKTS